MKDYLSARDFESLSGERIRSLELLAAKWDGEPGELKRLRSDAASRRQEDEFFGAALPLLGFTLVVILVVAGVWILVSALRWTWNHPLF